MRSGADGEKTRGWVWVCRLAKETVRGFQADECAYVAAGIAYYAIFSVFPLLLGLIAILGLVLEPAEVQPRLIDLAAQAFPSSRELVARNVEGVVASRQTLGIVSLVGLLWSGTAIFGAIRRSLNRA